MTKGITESSFTDLIIYVYADSLADAEAQFKQLDSCHYEMKLIKAPSHVRIGVEDTNYWGDNRGGKQVGSTHYWVGQK